MPVDNCQHNFHHLSKVILPQHMKILAAMMSSPLKVSLLATVTQGTFLKSRGLTRDFPGCYVFLKAGEPFYVGISRTVVKRLYQHSLGRDENTATLAYAMAKKSNPHKFTRKAAMKDPAFLRAFDLAKQKIAKMDVAFVPIDNDLELYVFEAYACMQLDCCDFNSFRTH